MKKILLLVLLISILFAAPRGYHPIFTNESNATAYDWNAIKSKQINTRALLMAAFDSTYYKKNTTIPQLEHYTKADIRGVRLGAGGTLNFKRPWLYLISGSINSFAKDFNSSTQDHFTLYDALLDIPLYNRYARMQVGRMKEPISMERLMGMVFEQVMERPMHLETFTTTRSDGISFSNVYFSAHGTFRSGLFSSDQNFVWATRATILPYLNIKKHHLIHLGISYRYEKLHNNKISLNVKPEQHFVKPILTTDTILANSDDTWNFEFTYLHNSLWIAAEYTAKYIHTLHNSNLFFYGFHTSFSYFITGEKRGYNKRFGVVRRIRPKIDFNDGGLGALEFAYRYSYINLNDKNTNAGTMDIHSIGAIWHATYGTQLHLQFTRANPKVSTLDGVDPLDSIQLRFVIIID